MGEAINQTEIESIRFALLHLFLARAAALRHAAPAQSAARGHSCRNGFTPSSYPLLQQWGCIRTRVVNRRSPESLITGPIAARLLLTAPYFEPYFGCQAKIKSAFDALSSICWGILIMMGSYEPLWPFHSSSPQETVPILKKAHKSRIVSRKVLSLTPTFHSRLQPRPRANWIDSISVWLIASPTFLSCEILESDTERFFFESNRWLSQKCSNL